MAGLGSYAVNCRSSDVNDLRHGTGTVIVRSPLNINKNIVLPWTRITIMSRRYEGSNLAVHSRERFERSITPQRK